MLVINLDHNGISYRSSTPDQLAAAGLSADVILAGVKSHLSKLIDDQAEACRLKIITPGAGQAMEYQEAYAEAVQVDGLVKAGQAVSADAFPMLSASVGTSLDPTTGKPTVDVSGEARSVLAAYDDYQKAGAAIRGVRLDGKKLVNGAADIATAEAAKAAIVWPV